MLLPTTYALTLALLMISVLCWGSWANALKKSHWRFELYYLDFCVGAILAALIAAFTVGSMGPDLSVQDSFLLVSKRPVLLAFVAGCVFNLGNMLVVAAIEVSGMGIAFLIGLGMALIVSVMWNYILLENGNLWMILGGCIIVLVSVILAAVAHGMMEAVRRKSAAALAASLAPPEELTKAAIPGARKKRAEEESGPGAMLGVWLALSGGLVLGCFYPLMGMSMEGELGFSNPFSVALIVSIGMLVSSLIYNLYFMNLPVKGLPISFFAYFTGSLGQHGLGLLGGMIWMAGACANFSAAAAQGEAKLGTAIVYTLGYGSALISLIWGVFVWKEFANATSGISRLLSTAAILFASGLAVVVLGLHP